MTKLLTKIGSKISLDSFFTDSDLISRKKLANSKSYDSKLCELESDSYDISLRINEVLLSCFIFNKYL